MSSEIALSVEDLSKCYMMFNQPQDRLKQSLLPRLRRIAGLTPLNYYKEFWALKNVSFDVNRGEAVGIIGCNGSGKSTLLQLICGTLAPTSGTVGVHGRIAALLELGSGFNPEFTGRENIYLNSAIFGLLPAEVDERMSDILSFADIGEFVDQPVKTYSSGMFVRLAFAVQACLEPNILVIDEALAVGDALFQKRCYERIEKLIGGGTTLLFVSHDEEAIRTLTNRVVLLTKGSVSMIGPPAQALLEYRRQLHEQERTYLTALAKEVTEHVKSADLAPKPLGSGATDRWSFGDLEAEILAVRVLNGNGEEQSAFYPTDPMRIEVTLVTHEALLNLNVSLRLRNKEGVKIYSWGTLNQDMQIAGTNAPLFWERAFQRGQTFRIAFDFICGLGANLYEVQAAVTHEGKPYYAEQKMLHWRDEAAFFTVTTRPREYHFGGVVDLRMSASIIEVRSA